MPIHGVAFGMLGDDAVDARDEDIIIEYPPRDRGKGARVTLRLPPRLVAYIAELAISNDRSLASEVQVALEVHENLSRLAAVTNTEEQERQRRASGGLRGVVGPSADRFADHMRNQIARDWSESFFDDPARAAEFTASLLGRTGD